MLSCREITLLLSESLDHPLKLRERMALKIHLAMCDGCHSFEKQMFSLRGIAKQYVNGAADKLIKSEDETPPPPL